MSPAQPSIPKSSVNFLTFSRSSVLTVGRVVDRERNMSDCEGGRDTSRCFSAQCVTVTGRMVTDSQPLYNSTTFLIVSSHANRLSGFYLINILTLDLFVLFHSTVNYIFIQISSRHSVHSSDWLKCLEIQHHEQNMFISVCQPAQGQSC